MNEGYKSLTFDQVRVINVARARRWHNGFPDGDDPWTGADWSNAMMGEAGEAANVVKKLRRGETGLNGAVDPDRQKLIEWLGHELADTILYAILLAEFYGVDLPRSIVEKFDAISVREGFPERLAPYVEGTYPVWQSGFESGVNDIKADYQAALGDLLPEDVNAESPKQLAEYILGLQDRILDLSDE